MPTMNATPALPRPLATCLTAPDRMSLAGPGVSAARLSRIGCVADGPISPMIDTSAMIAGKIASTP